MQLNIKYKLFFAILSAHIIVYIAMYSLGRYSFDRGFLEYISRIEERQVPALVEGLSDFHERTGSWETLRRNPRKWLALVRSSIESANDPEVPTAVAAQRPVPGGSNDWYYASEYSPARPYLLLLDAQQNVIFGNAQALPLANLHPIIARGNTVGYLAVTSRQELSEQADLLFSQQQKQSFFLFAAILVMISALVAFPVSSLLVRPVRDIVDGTRALTRGDYNSRLAVRSSDEIGQLAEDFNTLAKTLDQNRSARQQWIADISHELRTPLAILQGEIESVQDGIRPLGPETLESFHQEVSHLSTLVNDLHELSMSDLGALVYRKETLDLGKVLEQTIDMHRQLLNKHHIRLTRNIDVPEGQTLSMLGDENRLSQLFDNLMQNTCRYTDEGGQLVVHVKETQNAIDIDWFDSGPGVRDEDLDRLFERLYRLETSRNRNKGGSGLGLAICKNIVEAHDGTISAEHSPLGGLRIHIQFPHRLQQA
ncbi:MAG: ATP-binding protein [Pseudomonadales bacterium]|nr:ATP-binding protein [Pseudomonadales bacterium]